MLRVNGMEMRMKTDQPEGCSYEIHSWRGDGTNGSILHSRKVHTCEITSLFHEPSLGSDINLVFPDLQFIPTSCGAKAAHSIYLKQLECAGLESWGRKNEDLEDEAVLAIEDDGYDQVAHQEDGGNDKVEHQKDGDQVENQVYDPGHVKVS